MKYFIRFFRHLNLLNYCCVSGSICMYIFKLAQYICHFALLDFNIIPGPVGFVVSPVGNLLLGLTPENFAKFDIFPSELRSPYRTTKTGCHYHEVKSININILQVKIEQAKFTYSPLDETFKKQTNN